MALCLIALGSNLGDRAASLAQAAAELHDLRDTHVVRHSETIETRPVGGPQDQPPFLNAAVLIETQLAPSELLGCTRHIETRMGRRRDLSWGPRTIDLDILLYERQVIASPQLTIPHPWLAVRPFVLEPAAQVAPDMIHPLIERPLSAIWRHLAQVPPVALLIHPAQQLTARLEQLLRELSPQLPIQVLEGFLATDQVVGLQQAHLAAYYDSSHGATSPRLLIAHCQEGHGGEPQRSAIIELANLSPAPRVLIGLVADGMRLAPWRNEMTACIDGTIASQVASARLPFVLIGESDRTLDYLLAALASLLPSSALH